MIANLTAAEAFEKETNFNRRIILIDDNASVLEDFKKVLEFKPDSELKDLSNSLFENNKQIRSDQLRPTPTFEVEAVLKGEDGYELVVERKKAGQPFALAFVDMRMPMGWDGLETIKKLWSADPDLEIVICTAYSDYSWENLVNELDHQDRLLMLKKPFEPIEVCQLSLSLTEKWNLSRLAQLKMQEMQSLVEAKTQEVVVANRARTNFLNVLGHEFLTPLNGVLGFTQILKSQYGDSLQDTAIDYLDYIEMSGEKLHSLLSDMLDTVSSSSGRLMIRPVPNSPEDLIERALVQFSRQSESHVVRLKNHRLKTPVMSDPKRFTQILLNLLNNACKYSPEHLPLEIEVISQGAQIRFEVKDQGEGIDEEKQKDLFQPFVDKSSFPPKETLARISMEGVGVGLALAKYLVEAQGGEIGLESTKGEGTTAWFTLPVAN